MGIGLILFHDGNDGSRTDETSQVVDMAMCVIAGNSAAEPEHLLNSQRIGKHSLELVPLDSRIARLDRIEQALLGGEQETGTVDVDAASLKDHASLTEHRLP